ncbi:MAG: Stage II sporulation protein M [Thermoanaerobacterales bacterium 50_218]|nr:MAG: Stage II sporulation protein M [Thermoanaerobacterales bacterium 50_218]HAA90441.1 stage II sporulation protein M [Peptococcaceae bacterium]
MQLPVLRISFGPKEKILIPLFLVTGSFIIGVVAGALFLRFLDPVQHQELCSYLESFLRGTGTPTSGLTSSEKLLLWWLALKIQLISLLLLWFSGLTVLGVPLILFVVGARGFILGFTVGFLVKERAAEGIFLAVAAILPQNLFYVPALLGAAIIAYYFSSFLLLGFGKGFNWYNFIVYTFLFVLIFLLLLVGTLVEAYLVPGVMRLVLLFS